jgi:hypothetical protein
MQDVTFSVPDTQEEKESSNRPSLPKGTYLAVITGVEEKVNPLKGSRGLMWSLLINANPESVKDGWDSEARPVPQSHYVYLGKVMPDGKFEAAKNKFNLYQMQTALEIGTEFKKSDVMHRQITVKVDLKPSMDDEAALKADPTHTVERWWPEVKSIVPYVVDGKKGPVLANLAEAAADLASGQSDPGGEF